MLEKSTIVTFWDRFTEPHDLVRAPEQRYRARLLSSLLIVAFFLILLDLAKVWLQTNLAYAPAQGSGIYLLPAALASIAIAYGLSRTQHYTLAAALTVGIVLVVTYVLAIISAPDPLYLAVLILGGLSCSLFLSLRVTTLVLGFTFAEILLLAILVPGFSSSDILNALMFIMGAGALIVVATSIRQRYLEQTEQRSREPSNDLTRHKRTEDAQAAESDLLRTLMDNVPDTVYFKDTASRFIRINPAQVRRLGLSDPAQAVGKTDFDFFSEEHARSAYADEQAIIRSGQPVVGKEEMESWPDGRVAWASTTKLPLRDENGNIIGTFGISRDITERKQMQEVLRKQIEDELTQERNLMRQLMDNMPDAIYFKDAKSRFTRINRAHARLFGLSDPAQAVGKTDFDFFTEEHARPAYEDEQAIIGSGQPLVGKEEKETQPDGRVGWVSTTKMPLRDQTGRIVGTFGISRDITERKHAEDALAAERNLLRSLIDHVPDYIYVKDTQSRFLTANPALARLMGVGTPDELLGKTDFDFYPQELAAKFYADEQAILHSGQPMLGYEEVTVDTSGRSIWQSTTKVPLRDAQGKIFGLVGKGADITERKHMEEALRESEERFRKLFEASPDAVLLLDTQDQNWPIIDCNPAACEMNGYAREELIGQPIDLLNATASDLANRPAFLEHMRREGVLKYEAYHRHKNGTVFPVEVSSAVIKVQDKDLVLGIDRDITERKRTEETLRQLSTQDSLTGLYNRAFFEGELKRLETSRLFPVSIIMSDVDDMKKTNDREGHAAGDELLRRTAAVLTATFRGEDIIARIGGDEFAMLLPKTTADAARHAVDRCRMEVNRQNQVSGEPPLSLSIGAATAPNSENLMQTLRLADENMYQDKATHKDRSGNEEIV